MHQLRSTTVYERGTISKGNLTQVRFALGRKGYPKQTGTHRPTLYSLTRPIKIDADKVSPKPGELELPVCCASRLLWPSVLFKGEELLRAERFIVDLSRSLDQVLQVSPEKVVIRLCCCARRSYSCILTWSGNCAATRTRNVSRPPHLPHPSGFSDRARPSRR